MLASKTYSCSACGSLERIEMDVEQEQHLLRHARYVMQQDAQVQSPYTTEDVSQAVVGYTGVLSEVLRNYLVQHPNAGTVWDILQGYRYVLRRDKEHRSMIYQEQLGSFNMHQHLSRTFGHSAVEYGHSWPFLSQNNHFPGHVLQDEDDFQQYGEIYYHDMVGGNMLMEVQDASTSDLLALEDDDENAEGELRETFMEYSPMKLTYGSPHPDPVVETSSLASVDPPDITYQPNAKASLVDNQRLSALQLEAVLYACQRHEQRLPDGSRAGFFIGDGAGVGKGRTIAGIILENWSQGRQRHLWISVGTDLKFDARRDLDDVGAFHIPLHLLSKIPYGKIDGKKINIKSGVLFMTYSSLISSSDRGLSRIKQIRQWCGHNFDGLIIFDESHKVSRSLSLILLLSARSFRVAVEVFYGARL